MTMETFKARVTTTDRPNEYQAAVRDFTIRLAPDSPAATSSHEAVLQALGACEAIVMASFNKQQDFTYRDVYYTLEGTKPADVKRPGFDRIGVAVHLNTDEPKHKCQDFMTFTENTCPVMDNLTHTVPVKRTGIAVKA
ncbi:MULTISPECIES: OsmC family protein [Lactobacillaceae]|uniref:OsmC family protein n=1 Tax=Lactobacillaceae TaxID=33958 RepID=UPI0014578081|nr:OsmC family protein [Lactobacillus sp. HBUAS51381]NLR10629.1 OsmC family protein [Lactobacillus sp. HBUAS51381]